MPLQVHFNGKTTGACIPKVCAAVNNSPRDNDIALVAPPYELQAGGGLLALLHFGNALFQCLDRCGAMQYNLLISNSSRLTTRSFANALCKQALEVVLHVLARARPFAHQQARSWLLTASIRLYAT